MAERILAIDDDEDALGVIRGFLQEDGFEVETATGGVAGLERAAANVPDLILLDVVMPEMNGMEVFKRLRAKPETSAVPVIFLTALQEKKYVKAALQAGVEHYVTKPFDSEDLLEKVRQALSDKL